MVQCQGILSKEDDVALVRQWVATPGHDARALGPAEMIVHVLSSNPDVPERLHALQLHYQVQDDLPQKVRARGG